MLLLPGAFSPAGGLEMYDRLLIKSFCELTAEVDGRVEAIVLNDQENDVDHRYFNRSICRVKTMARSHSRFIAAALASVTRMQPALILMGHVNFGPLAFTLKFVAPRARICFVTYGIDFWRRLSPLKRAALRQADIIISISNFTRREGAVVNGLRENKIELLPCALDPFWERENAPSRRQAITNLPVILTVARLAQSERYKGIDTVLTSLPAVRAAIPGVKYVIVGDGDDRLRMTELARSLGIADCVEFRGRVSSAELARAYDECSLFAMPSQKEGFGIVFLEAALFAKPSVAGNHGGSPEVVSPETGRLVQYGDVKALTDTLIDLLANPQVTHGLGNAARERLARDFRYPRFAERVGELFGEKG